MQRNVAKDCGIPFSLVPYPGKNWKILSVMVSGVERMGAQKMENCENVFVVRNDAGYSANWLRRIAFLLVFSLLAAGAERCFPLVVQDPAGRAEDNRTVPEETVPLSEAGMNSAEGFPGPVEDGADPETVCPVSAADVSADTYPTDLVSAAGAAEISGALPCPDAPENAEGVIPGSREPDIPVSLPTAAEDGTAGEEDAVSPGIPSDGRAENGETAEETAGSVNTVGGFLVDEAGMICGIADASAAVDDGVLILPSEGCTGIKTGAFLEAPAGIVEVYLPENIAVIETGAFLGLTEVEWYEAEAENGEYYTEDGIIFSENGTCILAFPPGRTGIYPVPAQVTAFADDAFAGARIEKLITVECGLTDTENLPESIAVM